ncbi:hypothetical protein Tco_0273405 [Tanacetum coccineum]
MDDPNMTMEEYINLEEEKARRCGQVFSWETATYGKIRVDDDLHDLRSVEAEFLVIVIDDTFAPQDALLCKSQVSTFVNDEIDFRISFDESDDEDYAIICNKNLFSYKMISVKLLSERHLFRISPPVTSIPYPRFTKFHHKYLYDYLLLTFHVYSRCYNHNLQDDDIMKIYLQFRKKKVNRLGCGYSMGIFGITDEDERTGIICCMQKVFGIDVPLTQS